MSDEDKDLTKTAIKKWQPYINLKLEFVDTDDGDIRIGTQRASGGQSLRGTNAKDAPPDQPTMTVRYTNNTRETSRVIQHEFGHALGIIHEHQHPANPIQYNVPALAEMFGEQFANQEFSSYQRIMTALLHVGPDEIKLTPYDPKSIMHYHVIDNFASGGDVKAPNYELSPGDKHLAETLYPPETPRTFLIQNARTGGTQAFEWDPGAEQPPESSELPESQVPPE
ncbi:M12 family metallopeptidase [Pseudomonas khavaziana]|uniref:M12 family metallopeptidase n=1 Tax=Pseudomonas khavaziana TaxID=2842351 RepID=UPI001C3CE745|nr:M12 family metallopeptidase [Pseudomonas khavaziana]MBV4478790.1 hypothetical protein [Pseudomonas khavaziana]